jgi:CHASE2 domain-containing sensor protein
VRVATPTKHAGSKANYSEVTDWWLTPVAWLFARRPDWRDALGKVLLRVGNRFYYALAIVFLLVSAWDLFVKQISPQLANASFSWLMSHRPISYKVDQDIVVVDIDEASLAALTPQYGLWPWPRQVLAEVASQLESAGARAVAFDIQFVDPDVANPSSEQVFDRYVTASQRSFYSAVRLNPENDASSGVSVSMLKFALPDPRVAADRVDAKRTIAVLPPYFRSIYESTRTGIVNIVPDGDNVVRWYNNFETVGGYRIPSLPYRMGQQLGWPLPTQSRSLLNWPRGVAPYHTIRFAEAYRAAESHNEAYYSQFAGKVVLIGSTAPSFNDIKATPVDGRYPGIDLLAVATDNTKNSRFLRTLHPAWIWSLEMLLLAASARMFIRATRVATVAKYLVIVPIALLMISLASISVSDLLMDLSAPAALVLGYFAVAKVFQLNSLGFASATGVFAPTENETANAVLQVACLPLSVPRDRVMRLLITPGCPNKLWEPPNTGLGKRWADQGWILWRWRQRKSEANAARRVPLDERDLDGDLELRWHEVPASDVEDDRFALAQAVVAAALVRSHDPEP